jgi:hypothetical protein
VTLSLRLGVPVGHTACKPARPRACTQTLPAKSTPGRPASPRSPTCNRT